MIVGSESFKDSYIGSRRTNGYGVYKIYYISEELVVLELVNSIRKNIIVYVNN